MALPGNKNFSDYDNYITDTNPTTSAQAQDYFRNQAELLKAVIDCDFWQPETVYQPGDVVKSDSMPNGTEAVMVATKASVTSNVEPQWGAVGSVNISDGACFWKLRFKNWGKTEEEARNALSTNLKTYTTFEQLGLTATATLLEVVNAMPKESQFVQYIGANSYEAFGVPQPGIVTILKAQGVNYANLWFQRYGGAGVIRRAWFENWASGQTSFTWKEIAFLEKGTLPIDKGGTGGNTFIKSASISGKNITLNISDGTTENLATQDTIPTAVSLGASTYDLTGRVTTLYSNSNGFPEGDITLAQPYTNFKALCVVIGSDTQNQYVTTEIVSIWELQKRKAIGTTSFSLCYGSYYWALKAT